MKLNILLFLLFAIICIANLEIYQSAEVFCNFTNSLADLAAYPSKLDCTNVRVILQYKNLDNIAGLSAIKDFKTANHVTLDFLNNNIQDISPILNLKDLKLTYLQIAFVHNKITKIQGMTELEPLKATLNTFLLDLSENQITDISQLNTLAQFTLLEKTQFKLQSNQIESLTVFSFVESLLKLTDIQMLLNNNLISDISFLSKLAPQKTTLKTLSLDLNHNKLTDISPINICKEMPQITKFSFKIKQNTITELSPILSLTNFLTSALFSFEIDEEQSRCFRKTELFGDYAIFKTFVNQNPKCFVSTCAATSECNTGLFCNIQSKKCNNCAKNCDSCSEANNCQICMPQYYLLNQGCEPCLSFIVGCSSSCTKEQKCINCKTLGTDCVACFESCSVCFNEDACNVCTLKPLWNNKTKKCQTKYGKIIESFIIYIIFISLIIFSF